MTEELKLCPFCEGNAELIPHATLKSTCWRVHCTWDGCGVHTALWVTEAEAITAWNTRAMPTSSFDALRAAYLAGAEDVHNAWIAGNGQSEPDFGEAAADYAAEHAGVEDAELVQLRATNAELLTEIERQRTSGDGDVALIDALLAINAKMQDVLKKIIEIDQKDEGFWGPNIHTGYAHWHGYRVDGPSAKIARAAITHTKVVASSTTDAIDMGMVTALLISQCLKTQNGG